MENYSTKAGPFWFLLRTKQIGTKLKAALPLRLPFCTYGAEISKVSGQRMDRTLFKNQNIRENSTLSTTCQWQRRVVKLLALTGAGLLMGCQATQFGQAPVLPSPPSSLDLSQIQQDDDAARNAGAPRETVRYQSPDPSGRVRSLNDFSYEAAALNEAEILAQQPKSRASERVAEVVINGNQLLDEYELLRTMKTRPGRFFDPDKLQQDVNQLWRTPGISRVKGPFLEKTPSGVIVTLEIVESSSIGEVKFVGNRGISDAALRRDTGLKDGQPLDVHQIRMAKTKIEEFYKRKGYPRTQVEVMEGGEAGDSRVVFLIHEDEKQRIWKVEFEGNTIAPDGRLKALIKSKPGILKLIGGLVKRNEVEQDITRLTSYYRSLGFFNARIGREISESNDGRWLNLRFIINEGPRYQVRQISFIGNRVYESQQLESLLELRPSEAGSPEFNVSDMNADVVALRELYGGEGFIFANIVAEPRFLEEPGLLDIVYKIEEGKQYHAGEIRIHYEGGSSVTRREVALNRVSVRTGDKISVQEVRNSERRLRAANIFNTGAQGGSAPRIVLSPADGTSPLSAGGGGGSRTASRPSGGGGSGTR